MFHESYLEQLAEAKGLLRARLNLLKSQPVMEGWCRINGFDKLVGKYRELGKVRFKANNTQHRPLGFFGPEQKMFTLLIWATERDGKFDPPNVRDTALSRMNLVKQSPELAYASDF